MFARLLLALAPILLVQGQQEGAGPPPTSLQGQQRADGELPPPRRPYPTRQGSFGSFLSGENGTRSPSSFLPRPI